MTLLPFALYRVHNTPYRLGLTPFKIVYGRPPPIIPTLRMETINAFDADDNRLISSLRTLQHAHKDTWTRLKVLYETDSPPQPHHFQPSDWVFVRKHQRETLEPRWKGPYIVILTTPMALKVDGLATWIHHTHAWPADLHTLQDQTNPPSQWTVSRDSDNPLKIRIQKL